MGSEVPGGSLVAHVRRPTVAGAVNATVTNLTSVKQPRRDPEIRRFQAHFRLIPPCKRIQRNRATMNSCHHPKLPEVETVML